MSVVYTLYIYENGYYDRPMYQTGYPVVYTSRERAEKQRKIEKEVYNSNYNSWEVEVIELKLVTDD